MKEKYQTSKYNLSFTAGGLYLHESVNIAALFLESQSWEKTRSQVIENNILKTRTTSTAKRLFREISLRLKNLTQEALEYLVSSSNENGKKQLLWYYICRTYPFIADFSKEVIHSKVASLDYSLCDDDYDRFFNKKAQWHGELESISISTARKIKQVLFRMLREVDFLSTSGDILIISPQQRIMEIARHDGKVSLDIFPLPTVYLREACA